MVSTANSAAYESNGRGLIWNRPVKDRILPTVLASFDAKIVGDVIRDDGAERTRLFEVEAKVVGRDRVTRFSIPADQFPAVGRWSAEHLGAGAVLSPGIGAAEHARFAIQTLSPPVAEHTIYAHTGWREVDGQWRYLHAGGALGPVYPHGDRANRVNAVITVETDLESELRHYLFPDLPAELADLRRAVKASLDLLGVAPHRVMVPILGAAYRAPLGRSDLSVFTVGPTGCLKTSVVAVVAQHYGAGLTADNLPGNYLSTGNSLEDLAFRLKDCLFIVDDFCPSSHPGESNRMHSAAERIHRSQGNNAGRGRLRADLARRPVHPPRGLVLSTGEELPRGHSNISRLVVVEISPGEIGSAPLRLAQAAGAAGTYATAMAGFISWLACDYPAYREASKRDVITYATELGPGPHARTAPNVSELAVGWRRYLDFAVDLGAVEEAESEVVWKNVRAALAELAGAQQAHLRESAPGPRFLNLLRSAVSSGEAHLASAAGDIPPVPGMWGWRSEEVGSGQYVELRWRPQGSRVGWVDNDDVYLDPDAALAVAQERARATGGTGLPAGRTLHKRLGEGGYLASTGAERILVRKTVGDCRRYVLHLRASTLTADSIDSITTTTDTPGAADSNHPDFGDAAILDFGGDR